MRSYRKFPRVILVLLISVTLIFVITGSAAAESDDYLGVPFHPFTMHSTNSTCALGDVHDMRNCDPVNLIFPGRTWVEVRDLLISHDWTTSGLGSGQWLHFDGETMYSDNEQLFRADGQNQDGEPMRYHIRLWQAPTSTLVTFAAVHHESGRFIHTIDMSWEDAEGFVAGQLCGSGCQQTGLLEAQDLIQGEDGDWRGWDNDGSATVIPGPTTTDEPPTVDIVQPTEGSVVSGILDISADASDDNGVMQVEFFVNGASIGSDTAAPYQVSWDSNAVGDGGHVISVTATDSASQTASDSINVTVDNINDPPTADFTYTCTALSCEFDANNSSDPDGFIVSYVWDFGDGKGGSGASASHTYDLASTYTVTLTVTDDGGATDSQSLSVTVNEATTNMHVGDLEGSSVLAPRNRWDATVTVVVHDASEGPVANATVNGAWSIGGGGSCTTNGSGQCDIVKNNIKGNEDSATFTVTSVSANGYVYDAGANHDLDGDSDGTTIVVYQDGPPEPTPEPSFVMHIGDLDGSGVQGPRNRWTATVVILVHDADEGAVSGATVSGSWSADRDGGSCTTDASGRCSIVKNDIKSNEPNASFTVDTVSLAGGAYYSGVNHDPDGDSDGTSITILQP